MTKICQNRLTTKKVVNLSEFMIRAHVLAKTFEGHYSACLKMAMLDLYKEVGCSGSKPKLVAKYIPDPEPCNGEVYGGFIIYDNKTAKELSIQSDSKSCSLVRMLHNINEKRSEHYDRSNGLKSSIRHLEIEMDRLMYRITRYVNSKPSTRMAEKLRDIKVAELNKEYNVLAQRMAGYNAQMIAYDITYHGKPRVDYIRWKKRKEYADKLYQLLTKDIDITKLDIAS